MLRRLSSIHRIVLGLVALSISALLVSSVLGLLPNPRPQEEQFRRSFCETTAITFMSLAARMDEQELRETLSQIRARQPEVLSIAVRRNSGELAVTCGATLPAEFQPASNLQDENLITVPILTQGKPWGQMEIWFRPLSGFTILSLNIRPDVALIAFVACSLFGGFSLYLRKVLTQLSPHKVVPNRVREALNALAEGLLVLDSNHKIVLANASFADSVGRDPDGLIGMQPSRFQFKAVDTDESEDFPWEITARESRPIRGKLLNFTGPTEERTFSVSTVPVRDDKNQTRGVVASFEDVTELQTQQKELSQALVSLRASSEEIRTQNRELEWLATRDALTGCLNRRSFFRSYEAEWETAHKQRTPLSAIMIDIDHFKQINDTYGHSTGDEVLRQVSAAVVKTVDDNDYVCRYGGEEFTVLLPGLSLDEAELTAEKCRLAIKALLISELSVTASLGVSSLCQKPDNPQALLDQADQCLYAAKRSGRNRVIRWDRAQAMLNDESAETPASDDGRGDASTEDQRASAIPYHAVAALTTALAHRDHAAAVHSRRVADLCVATAEGLLSMRQCYILEMAALLHDIGKIGIPDSILKKNGPLSDDELQQAARYNQISVEIVRGSFGQPVLSEIVEQNVVWFDMTNSDRGAGPDQRPSLAARILAIANAYDTMTSDVSCRRQMTSAEALAELRRCSGTQFDPELVERFIGAIRLRGRIRCGDFNATRESALSIGLLLERLVNTLDDQDPRELNRLATRIQSVAEDHGLEDIAAMCRNLLDALSGEMDQIEVMHVAGELLDLCRSTQSTLLSAQPLLRSSAQTETAATGSGVDGDISTTALRS